MSLTDLILNEGQPPLFKRLNQEEIEVVKERTNIIMYEPNQKIIKAGEWGDSLYVLFQGIVNINHPGPNGRSRTTHQMTTGDFFGEMGFFADIKRSADVVPVNKALIGEISKRNFDAIMYEHPIISSKILYPAVEEMARRILDNNRQIEELYSLKKSFFKDMDLTNPIANDGYPPLFKRLNSEEVEAIRQRTEMRVYESDQKIIKAGEWGDSLYIIFQGKVNINHPGPNDTYLTIHQMTTGDFFGEMAFFAGIKRSADVVPAYKTLIGEITKKKFDTIMDEYPIAASKILYSTGEEMAKRILNNNQKIEKLYSHIKNS